ncbi:hypothetical protein vBKpnAMK6_00118 [Klebsiella phage vB_Kpn_AM_K6]
MSINLKDIALDTKQITVAYPGLPHFKLKVNYVSRKLSKKILEAAQETQFVNGIAVKVQNDDKFAEEFVKVAIEGWEGLTVADVEKLMLIDVPEDRLGDKVEFSIDNAVMLVRNSSAFETWMNSTVFHLDTFRDSKPEPTA